MRTKCEPTGTSEKLGDVGGIKGQTDYREEGWNGLGTSKEVLVVDTPLHW